MTDQATIPTIGIKRIKEISFQIREDLLLDSSRTILIEIGQNLSFAIDEGLVSFALRFYYHFAEEREPILVDFTVQNVFEIPNLQRFIFERGELKLPPVTISNIVGLSISHGRALLAKQLSGTVLQENLPYIVDPANVARHFFPRMFDVQTAQKADATPAS
ncbi:MAG TPA: hypothetical protein VHE34_06440 [Puia sp.]|uniref:hypothetical protein n=1 Tax=Puia sp. TaxID=2045100 RepID=UPI002BD0568F|nr:hypothetical protein [Puia sp.]HVU94843.1 hypothetical protein [Puia sp.]